MKACNEVDFIRCQIFAFEFDGHALAVIVKDTKHSMDHLWKQRKIFSSEHFPKQPRASYFGAIVLDLKNIRD